MGNVVFMVNIKNESVPTRVVPYEYSINSWRKWCDKNDCQLFVLDEYIFEPDYLRPNWYKLYVFDLLENSGIKVFPNGKLKTLKQVFAIIFITPTNPIITTIIMNGTKLIL